MVILTLPEYSAGVLLVFVGNGLHQNEKTQLTLFLVSATLVSSVLSEETDSFAAAFERFVRGAIQMSRPVHM